MKIRAIRAGRAEATTPATTIETPAEWPAPQVYLPGRKRTGD